MYNMNKTFLTIEESKSIENLKVVVKSKIVSFIKTKYNLELVNIDYLIQSIISMMMSAFAAQSNHKNGNMLKQAEKWFILSGIKTDFQRHSVYGFARTLDAFNYTIIIPKGKILTGIKYWIAKKLLM